MCGYRLEEYSPLQRTANYPLKGFNMIAKKKLARVEAINIIIKLAPNMSIEQFAKLLKKLANKGVIE